MKYFIQWRKILNKNNQKWILIIIRVFSVSVAAELYKIGLLHWHDMYRIVTSNEQFELGTLLRNDIVSMAMYPGV